MTPNQTRGQFQRNHSCQQQRSMANYAAMPQRTPASCQQPQENPSSCRQRRPVPPCSQPQKPAAPSCPPPSRPWNQMTQEQLLQWISMTKFACVEASLYLDTHPCDAEALAYFQEYNRLYNEAMNEYAKAYGPLTISHAKHCDTYWEWVNQPWPWQ